MGAAVAVTDESFEREVLQSAGLVLVDFWATWCAPCQRIAPVLEEVAAEQAGKLTVAKLDVDDNPSTAQRFGVMSIPTLILFRGGKEIERLGGAMGKEQLLRQLRPHLQ